MSHEFIYCLCSCQLIGDVLPVLHVVDGFRKNLHFAKNRHCASLRLVEKVNVEIVWWLIFAHLVLQSNDLEGVEITNVLVRSDDVPGTVAYDGCS